MRKDVRTHALAILFLLLLIDGISAGIIYPILTPILTSPISGILPVATSANLKMVYYAITISMFSFFSIFGATILGDLSDKIGRKNTLIIAMLGSFFAYMLSAFAVVIKSLLLLIMSRAAAGLTFGSQPVAQAVIVDISAPERKRANLGIVLLAICLGVTLGPVIGSLLSDSELVSFFNLSTPLYAAGAISLINAFLLWKFFEEKDQVFSRKKIKIFRGIDLFLDAFRNKQVRFLSLCFLLMQLGWGCYTLFTPYFLSERYQFSSREVGLYYFLMGLGLSIGFALLTTQIMQAISTKRLALWGLAVITVSIFFTGFVQKPASAWAMILPAAIADSFAYTTFITLFSNAVSKEHQGWVMGISTAIWGVAWGSIALASGFIAQEALALPLQIGSGFVFLSLILTFRYHAKKQRG
jgi:DHA1 family tetracycline resistance protein-like MFS transporter